MMILIGHPAGVLLRGISLPCTLSCLLPSLPFPESIYFSCTWRGNAAISLGPNDSTEEIVGGLGTRVGGVANTQQIHLGDLHGSYLEH
ncbi:uncharacterized protein BO88DRAFT_26181 [Aspergillus vadensis CBS 113365]|uniref:Secreted protein n=1 Tax=Aspergillus vadensis (strain CBS 113365 / IMI 142717 / IBT 24658) TaxID=1448311 RepID=A0A319D4E7_ASPVC|nr:hypothetical protein BO88DRAFT_26181 [Aspergillus vadensis CBS 113365]PYH74922.1 hypothetical protein BO88DRAFT_26181 [Aspergillus vadensis CBS 113365]